MHGVPGLRAVRLRPEIPHVVGAAELARDEVIDLAALAVRVADAGRVCVAGEAVVREHLPLHRRGDVAGVLAPLGVADLVRRDAVRGPASQDGLAAAEAFAHGPGQFPP